MEEIRNVLADETAAGGVCVKRGVSHRGCLTWIR